MKNLTSAEGQNDVAGRAIWLRRDAERIAGSLPPLLAEARQLASFVSSGLHGRRRAGQGEDFWQFRHAMPGDSAAMIDWRRSGRSDAVFVREKEWQAAQTVAIWSDRALSMTYSGGSTPFNKADRANLLGLALAVLLSAAGERISLLNTSADAAKNGELHLQRMAQALAKQSDSNEDYGAAPSGPFAAGSRLVLFSDFLGDCDALETTLAKAANAGVKGCMVQILDESEGTFPFDGRTIFESMTGAIDFETHRARALREAYQQKLSERRAFLRSICQRYGWQFLMHWTNESPRKALLWLYAGIGQYS